MIYQPQNLGMILITLGAFLIIMGALFCVTPRSLLRIRIQEPFRWQRGSLTAYFLSGICLLPVVLPTLVI